MHGNIFRRYRLLHVARIQIYKVVVINILLVNVKTGNIQTQVSCDVNITREHLVSAVQVKITARPSLRREMDAQSEYVHTFTQRAASSLLRFSSTNQLSSTLSYVTLCSWLYIDRRSSRKHYISFFRV